MALLEVSGLETYYGAIQALKGIDFHVNKGEIVTMIGSNGAGKSTTIKSISGLAEIKKGQIVYNEQTLNAMKTHEIIQLGIAHVPEGRRIFPKLTVRENLLLGAFVNRDKKNVTILLEQVFSHFPKLRDRLDQKGGTMSGGEQQMLAIGRALMQSPKLLMLDEPSMGLAPIIVEQIFAIIQELNKSGITILLVEQNAYQALQIAHRGYVMQTGLIKLSGTGSELIKNDEVKEAYLA